MRNHRARRQALFSSLPSSRPSTLAALKEEHPYIVALRSGDPAEIAKASLPEFFSEELLLQGLITIQEQPSLYDQFIDRISQQLTFRQYAQLVLSWKRYYDSLGEGIKSQNMFLRQMSERLNIRLEHQRDGAILEAEIKEAELRGARVDYERENLRKKPETLKPEGERPYGDSVQEARQWLQEEQARLKQAGVKEGDREWDLLLNKYDERINRIYGVR